MQTFPSLSARLPIDWKRKARSPKWWLGQPWFVIGLIFVFGFGFAAAVRQHGFSTDASLTNNPGQIPIPTTSGDQGCQNFADYWMYASGVGVDVKTIEDISTCRIAPDGSWFLPIGPADPRLPAGEAMTSSERAQTAKLRAQILAEIAVLDVSMPKNLRVSLNGIRTGDQRAVIEGIRRGANVEPMRRTYTRLVQAFLISPDNQALAGYIGWRMQQRSDALDTLVAKCKSDQSNAYLFKSCDTLPDALDIGYPPFIWELFNPLTLDNYLAHVVRNGNLPSTGA